MSSEIVVFAKQPVPGTVKTRLARTIGPVAASRVYAALLDHTLEAAVGSGLPVVLAVAGGEASDWTPPTPARVILQTGVDLGERMRNAFDARFESGAEGVILIGSDLPLVSADLLASAAAALGRVPIVLGPASDGGYWLIGQRAPGRDLFSDVPWSSHRTLAATREKIARTGEGHEELSELSDLDNHRDLRRTLEDRRVSSGLRQRIRAATADH